MSKKQKKLIDFDKEVSAWAKKCFGEINFNNRFIEDEYKTKILNYFNELEITSKKMDGFSVEGLLRDSRSEGAGGLNMSVIFHKLVNSGEINPGLYLAVYASDYLREGKDEEKLPGFLARALRSFGSFLREVDLESKLEKELKGSFSNVMTNMNPEQDTKKHVDIEVNCDEHTFNIWSYQASRRGLPNTLERLSGARGNISAGVHILRPIKTEEGMRFSGLEEQIKNRKERILRWKNELNNDPTPGRRRDLRRMLENNYNLLNEKIREYSELQEILSKEIILKHGWFLYPKYYVEKVSSLILSFVNGKQDIMKYNSLQTIIAKPQEIVSNVNIFEV